MENRLDDLLAIKVRRFKMKKTGREKMAGCVDCNNDPRRICIL